MTPKQIEALKLALEALEWIAAQRTGGMIQRKAMEPIVAIREVLKDHAMQEVQRLGQEIEQAPVAWLLTDKNINSLQVDDIQRLIDRLKHAHHTDLCVRINGQDEWFEADWLKHMVRASPPQRTWVGLTDDEKNDCLVSADPCEALAEPEARQLIEDVEQALKERNQ